MRNDKRGQIRIATERGCRNYEWKVVRRKQIQCYILCMLIAAVLLIGTIFSISVLITDAARQGQDEGEPSFKYYTSIQVSSGESLWSIAEKYRDGHYKSTQDYVDEVISMNHLQEADSLTAGQYLIIPYYSTDFVE